jgi:hypothetical protein
LLDSRFRLGGSAKEQDHNHAIDRAFIQLGLFVNARCRIAIGTCGTPQLASRL